MVLNNLARASQYQVQVRARTAAGYGHFSPVTTISTLPDGTHTHTQIHTDTHLVSINKTCLISVLVEDSPSRLLLTGVLVAVGLLVLVAVVIVAVFCFR